MHIETSSVFTKLYLCLAVVCEYFMNCAVSETDDLSRISPFQRLGT